MKTFDRIIAGIVLVVLVALYGCSPSTDPNTATANVTQTPSSNHNDRSVNSDKAGSVYHDSNDTKYVGRVQQDEYKTIEGMIVSVQSSSIPFDYGMGYGHGAANYAFEFVVVQCGTELITLIYPEPCAILQRQVSIKYKVLQPGSISVKAFITEYVGSSYSQLTWNSLQAAGIICRDSGIKYTK
jgi:hypothetical protein